jgi:hypothetical protein
MFLCVSHQSNMEFKNFLNVQAAICNKSILNENSENCSLFSADFIVLPVSYFFLAKITVEFYST